MSDQRRIGVPSKAGPNLGISRTEFDDLKRQVANLEIKLNEALSEKNQWNSILRKWQEERRVNKFKLVSGIEVKGIIEWVDRYTIGIYHPEVDGIEIIHKGAIATII